MVSCRNATPLASLAPPPILEPVRDPSEKSADIRIRPAFDRDDAMAAFGTGRDGKVSRDATIASRL